MSKGKYAARAANREVARDNALLVEKVAEIGELKKQLAQLTTELHRQQALTDSQVLAQATELSAKQIAAIRAEAQRFVAEHTKASQEAVQICFRHYHKADSYPMWFVTDILPLLVPDQDRRSALMAQYFAEEGTESFNRRDRRHAAENIQRSIAHNYATDDYVEKLGSIAEQIRDTPAALVPQGNKVMLRLPPDHPFPGDE